MVLRHTGFLPPGAYLPRAANLCHYSNFLHIGHDAFLSHARCQLSLPQTRGSQNLSGEAEPFGAEPVVDLDQVQPGGLIERADTGRNRFDRREVRSSVISIKCERRGAA